MESSYVLSSSKPSSSSSSSSSLSPSSSKPSSSKPSSKKAINVADMDSISHSMFKTSISELSSTTKSSGVGSSKVHGFSDESAFKAVYGSLSSSSKSPKTVISREERTMIRKEEIKLAFQAIRASECVDLLFIVDCTGSMSSYINQIKNDIKELHQVLKSKHVNLDMTFGFIRYTDFDMGASKYSILNLTRSTSEFVNFVSTINAEGGGDGPEDVFGGMNLIKSIPWRTNSTRVVIHIADAPCHGSEYHSLSDSHPAGDPNGITLDSLLMDVINLKLNYYFGHINLCDTGKMIDIFDRRVKQLSGNQTCISSFDSKETSTLNEKIFQSVEKSISAARSQLTASLLKSDKSEVDYTRKFTIDKTIPNFELLPSMSMLQTKFKMPSKILACLDKSYEMKINEITVWVKMAPNPFSQGATRLAYYGQDNHGRKIVLKQSKFMGKRNNSKKRYFESMECQTVAAKFALDFNTLRKSNDIKFAVAKVLQVKDSENPIYLSVEPFIEGEYEKFNSNSGWLKSGDSFSDIIQTFSHWTYHESKGGCIVVDIQGVKSFKDSKTNFILTDPAIHAEDVLRFGSTNLGKPGIIKFFESHKCNIHCEELGLKKPDFTISK